ncbi:MAG: Dabb family protein [Chloroflexi bacterium]|nr:Dabb family protein [Chloroflexota bacterium]
MLKHVVMWKLKDFAESGSKQDNARKMKSELEGLKHKIKEIKSIEVGINVNDSADSYDAVLYCEFDTRDDLSTYLNHPAHIKAADFVGKVRLERKVVDYET